MIEIGGIRGVLESCRIRGGSAGTCCESLGATNGGRNIGAGWITASAAGWMMMSSGGLKLGGSVTPPTGVPKGRMLGALMAGGGMGGGGYID